MMNKRALMVDLNKLKQISSKREDSLNAAAVVARGKDACYLHRHCCLSMFLCFYIYASNVYVYFCLAVAKLISDSNTWLGPNMEELGTASIKSLQQINSLRSTNL